MGVRSNSTTEESRNIFQNSDSTVGTTNPNDFLHSRHDIIIFPVAFTIVVRSCSFFYEVLAFTLQKCARAFRAMVMLARRVPILVLVQDRWQLLQTFCKNSCSHGVAFQLRAPGMCPQASRLVRAPRRSSGTASGWRSRVSAAAWASATAGKFNRSPEMSRETRRTTCASQSIYISSSHPPEKLLSQVVCPARVLPASALASHHLTSSSKVRQHTRRSLSPSARVNTARVKCDQCPA